MQSPGSTASAATPWVSMAPAVFVLIWSTGFVVARFGMPYAPPMSFLAWRYVFSIVLLCVWVRVSRVAWPQGAVQWRHLLVAGMLLHGGYLGGVWAAVKLGLTAGAVALIVGLQPLLTAIWLSAQGGRGQIGRWQWLGLALGFGGLVLVVGGKVGTPEISAANLLLALGALASITVGTLYQKRYVQPVDVRSANTVQLMGALLLTGPLALLETEPVQWVPQLLGAMAWSVLVLTMGGSSLLVWLIQRGAATQVTSLMYLVPPCTAVLAWMLFDEALTAPSLMGAALTVAGVALVVRRSGVVK